RQPQAWGPPCPNPDWSHERLMHRGNMRALSPSLPQSGTQRLCRCRPWEQLFSETRDTVFCDLRTPEAKGRMALQRLLGKAARSDLGCVLGVTEETIVEWLRRAAQKAPESHAHVLRALPGTAGPLAERWSCIRRRRSTAIRTAQAPPGVRPGGTGSGAVSPLRCASSWPRVLGHARCQGPGSSSR